MANAIAPRPSRKAPVAPIRRPIDLNSLHGEVHRFTGVVDRFGSFASRDGSTRTICLVELRLEPCGTTIRPDHWWFRLREVWSEAGVRVGGTVLFTAKRQRCSKGWEDPGNAQSRPQDRRSRRRREQVIGFGSTPRSVVVLKRRQGENHQLSELEQQLERARQEQDLASADLQRLGVHRDELLKQTAALRASLQHSHAHACSRLQRTRRLAAVGLCGGGRGRVLARPAGSLPAAGLRRSGTGAAGRTCPERVTGQSRG